MSSIRIIEEQDATGDLAELYGRYRAPCGGVDNILRIHSLLPATLPPHMDLYRSIMFGRGPLTRRQREMIATVVSRTNNCTYCLHHHSDALLRVTRDREFTDQIRHDFRGADLPPHDEAMLWFAEELTARPANDHSAGIGRLREAGLSDDAILHLTLIISYFNFVNRMANGLGVDLEPYWMADGYSDPKEPMSHDDR